MILDTITTIFQLYSICVLTITWDPLTACHSVKAVYMYACVCVECRLMKLRKKSAWLGAEVLSLAVSITTSCSALLSL